MSKSRSNSNSSSRQSKSKSNANNREQSEESSRSQNVRPKAFDAKQALERKMQEIAAKKLTTTTNQSQPPVNISECGSRRQNISFNKNDEDLLRNLHATPTNKPAPSPFLVAWHPPAKVSEYVSNEAGAVCFGKPLNEIRDLFNIH